MKTRDLFLFAVRILGLVFLYHGLSALPTSIFSAFGALFARAPWAFLSIGFMVTWQLALAWWLIGGAPQLMKRAYPSDVPPVQPPETL